MFESLLMSMLPAGFDLNAEITRLQAVLQQVQAGAVAMQQLQKDVAQLHQKLDKLLEGKTNDDDSISPSGNDDTSTNGNDSGSYIGKDE